MDELHFKLKPVKYKNKVYLALTLSDNVHFIYEERKLFKDRWICLDSKNPIVNPEFIPILNSAMDFLAKKQIEQLKVGA